VHVLLTGASGFIGAHVADELARLGAQVRAFCRSEPPPGARVDEWLPGDVTDGLAVAHAARGCEAVVHTAALYSYSRTDGPAMEAVNVEGTRNVLEAAARAAVGRVLVTSSSATCGPVAGRPATTVGAPRPV
jgi:nucleoside-diphosphate-sugar epimerase